MIQSRRLFLILAVLTAVFAAAFFIADGLTGAHASDAGFSLSRGEVIVSVALTNSYGMFLFAQGAEGWTVESGGVRYRMNADKIKLLLASLSELPVRRVFDSEIAAYGLDKPLAAVRVKTDAGRQYEYTFGNRGADANTVYAKNRSGAVILTDNAAVMQITGNLAAYRDKQVFTVDLLNLAYLEYGRGGVPVVRCRREGPTEWYMDYPYAAPARHIELTELVADMMGWTVAGYPDAGSNFDGGLKPPLETLTLTDTKGNTQKLGFGEIKGANRYARLGEQDNEVFLYAADADLSILSPDVLLFVAPLRAQMNEITGFQVVRGAEEWAFAYDPATGAASWQYGTLSEQEFVGVFYKFISITADGRDADAGDKTGGSPEAALVLNLKSGAAHRLELLSRGGHSYFMRINGVDTPYYINAKRLFSLLDRISELKVKEPNKSTSQI
jgi:hypothetical protein